MSGRQLEAWWALSPEDLAIVQADPGLTLAPLHPNSGIPAVSILLKLMPLPRAKEVCYRACIPSLLKYGDNITFFVWRALKGSSACGIRTIS